MANFQTGTVAESGPGRRTMQVEEAPHDVHGQQLPIVVPAVERGHVAGQGTPQVPTLHQLQDLHANAWLC